MLFAAGLTSSPNVLVDFFSFWNFPKKGTTFNPELPTIANQCTHLPTLSVTAEVLF